MTPGTAPFQNHPYAPQVCGGASRILLSQVSHGMRTERALARFAARRPSSPARGGVYGYGVKPGHVYSCHVVDTHEA